MREHVVRDELTGLYNRRHLMDLLAKAVTRAQRESDFGLSLVMIDIDHFKSINDRIGHLAGDAVLRQLSAVLTERVRSGDTLGRIGGEEFALLMPETAHEDAADISERLRQAVAGHVFRLDQGEPLEVTVSMGLAGWDAGMESMSDLLRAADQCLYRAKEQGRNRVCSSSDSV
jgi:two-component system cell cycle response regulator